MESISQVLICDLIQEGLIMYVLPLRSCNTMATDVDDGIEYFNTVVVQVFFQVLQRIL